MAPNTGIGESQSSIAFSMNPRDSRVVSIYDKYLYDPKDLESSDPRRRELARKASQLKLHGRPANDLDANGLRSVASSSSNPRPAQRKSIAFSHNTKVVDGHTASSHNATAPPSRHPQQRPRDAADSSDRIDDTHDRDSGAFGLGLGMLGGSDSESDSDSDDDRSAPRNPALDKLKRGKESDRPDSWTDRANAVGHRPPDHASQNPPSLKLMALKSAKERADPFNSSQDERNSRLAVDPNFVDRTSRHGSTIGFAGHHIDNQRPSGAPVEAGNTSKRLSARTALTKQLGLASPNPEPVGAPLARGASPVKPPAPQDYFDSRAPNATQARSPPRNGGPAPIDVGRAQQHSFGPQDGRGMPSPHGSVSTPNSATPLRSPGYGPNGMPSPNYPHAQGPMPPNVLQRGPPSPYGQRGPPGPGGPAGPGGPNGPNGANGPGNYGNSNQHSHNTSPTRPGPGQGPAGANPAYPSSLQAGGARPPPPHMQRGPGPQGPNGPQARGPSGSNGSFGPSFSDAPGASKRQSIFRRSMAMFGAAPQAGPPGQGPSRPGNHPPPTSRAQPQQKRQSLFRRSMVMLTGGNSNGNSNGGAPPPPGNGQPMRMPAPEPRRAPPAPRVQGLQNDWEKPDHPRKSQFLGAGGAGAEWDTDGEGAKFWRRFSMAQKNAGTHKLEDGSRAWMASMASGRRKLIVMGVIALVSLVGIIVGVIVWREIVSPSGSTSDEPTSIYKANLGAKGDTTASATASTTASSRKAKASASATATATAGSNFYTRSLGVDAIVDEVVERQLPHSRRADGTRMHRRHFGRAAIAPAPAQLAQLD